MSDDWDDLRYILAVARSGTIGGGASRLGVNPTTVSRRLRAMEERAGTALFEKLKHGAVLTAAGDEMVSVAESVEQLTNDLDARIHGLDTRLEGSLRVTSVTFALRMWMQDFRDFRERYDGIDLELTATPQVANLTQREADVAIRIAPSAPDYLIGWKYAEVFFAVYGRKDVVEEQAPQAPYDVYPWLSWDLGVARNTDVWLQKHAPQSEVVLRVDQMPLMYMSIDAGLGVSIVPCMVGDANPNWRRVGDYLEGGTHMWLLTHPQLRRTARVTAFMAFMRELLKRDKDLIEGRRPSHG